MRTANRTSNRPRGNGLKGSFRLNIMKNFFTTRAMEHWKRIPREVAESPSLEVFKIWGYDLVLDLAVLG